MCNIIICTTSYLTYLGKIRRRNYNERPAILQDKHPFEIETFS